jgi:hypothetical protein
MLSRVICFALPALLFAGSFLTAQWPLPRPPIRGDLSGTYVNTSNGGVCDVHRQGRDYLFVNENGTPARFRFVNPGQLRMAWGDWNPDTVATPGIGGDGRPFIRFQEPGNRPGYWVLQ